MKFSNLTICAAVFATTALVSVPAIAENGNYTNPDGSPLTVPAGHFYTIIGYEAVTAPDNFFYSHSFQMWNSEPFTHTGFLGSGVGGSFEAYGGWTTGWDSGFANNDDGFIGGLRGSASFPIFDGGGGWAIRNQTNIGFTNMESPFFSDQSDTTTIGSTMFYWQSISGNAVGIGAGIASRAEQFDATWIDIGAQFNFNRWKVTADIAFGEFEFDNSNQKEDFHEVSGEVAYYFHDFHFALAAFLKYGEIDGTFVDQDITYYGLRADIAPHPEQALSYTTTVGFVDRSFDNPSQQDIENWKVVAGVRIDFNSAQPDTGTPLNLRARQTLNTPWRMIAPATVKYRW